MITRHGWYGGFSCIIIHRFRKPETKLLRKKKPSILNICRLMFLALLPRQYSMTTIYIAFTLH